MGRFEHSEGDFQSELLRIITRHPMRQEQIIQTFLSEKLNKKAILKQLEELESQNVIMKRIYNNDIFWRKK